MTTDTEDYIPELKERDNPVQAYRLTMTLTNPPGPFAMVEGSAQYDVTNHNACGEVNREAGTISRINTHPPIQWEQRSATEYVATVHADLMIDEDYYGRGVCHWAFTEARARLKATGAAAETRFVPAISAEEIAAEQAVIWYFWKGGYPVYTPLPSNGIGFPEFGQKSLNNVPADKKHEFFIITLSAQAVQP